MNRASWLSRDRTLNDALRITELRELRSQGIGRNLVAQRDLVRRINAIEQEIQNLRRR